MKEGSRPPSALRAVGGLGPQANALSKLQGDAAGEVDFIREMQGNIRSLFTKIDFPRNADGRIISNTPGIDAVEINRITGEVINEFQVKTRLFLLGCPAYYIICNTKTGKSHSRK